MKTKVLEIILNALSDAEDDLYHAKLDIFQLEVDKLKQCLEWLESLQEQSQITYKKYEFCKSVNCSGLYYENCSGLYNKCCVHGCYHTAKRFHNWLQENNFKIIKDI